MDQMWNVLQKSDVVFPSTAATTTIIDPEPLKEVTITIATSCNLGDSLCYCSCHYYCYYYF